MGTLGDRMKQYESVYHHHALRKTPLVIRVDGRAFHARTIAWGCEKPFDYSLRVDMLFAAQQVASGLQGFVVGYHQSDEVSFVLCDDKRVESEPHFGYDIQKVVSTTTSAMTSRFDRDAEFDCRAFSVPPHEVSNYLLWRAKDWERNSLQMLARSHFSHKQLDGKNRQEMHEMLYSVGVNWNDLPDHWKNGTFFLSDGKRASNWKPNFDSIDLLWRGARTIYLGTDPA